MPIGNSPWRGPPVPIGTPMDEREDTPLRGPGETSCRPTSSPTSHRRTIRTRDTPSRRVWCRPGCSPARARRRINRGRISRLRTTMARRPRTRRGYRRRRIRTRGHRPRSDRRALRIAAAVSRGPTTSGPARGPAAPAPPPPAPAAPPPSVVNPPQASGAAYGTYDQNTGVFVDPAGGTGVYAPGAANTAPAGELGRSHALSEADLMTSTHDSFGAGRAPPRIPGRRTGQRQGRRGHRVRVDDTGFGRGTDADCSQVRQGWRHRHAGRRTGGWSRSSRWCSRSSRRVCSALRWR